MAKEADNLALDSHALAAAKARTLDALFGADGASPSKIGAYTIEDVLGRGAMGVVYLARDARLDRPVALKLIEPRKRTDAEARASLVAEATQLARVQHPNVVAVYEVGEHEETSFIAMEYVAGPTLREWCNAQGRSKEQILRVYADAGLGLAAVHGAGLLHRDFKPSNVLVTPSGLAKVADFGLARFETDDVESPTSDGVRRRGFRASSTSIAGTPAYMAPEQFDGTVTARSDQFAFAVALLEALTGTRPFGGEPVSQLDAAAVRRCLSALDRRNLPGWLFAVLARAVAWDPEERWPDMDALVAQLERGLNRRRLRWVGVGVALVAVGTAGAVWGASTGREENPCSGASAKIESAWNEARRESVRDAFLGSDVEFRETAWRRTAREVDRYVAAWVEGHEEACAATTIRGEQSTAIMDLRMACLRRAKTTLEATTDVLIEADASVVVRAHEVVAGLTPLERCADEAALAEEVEPPLAQEEDAVEAVRATLARVGALISAGRDHAAEDVLDEAFEALRSIEYPVIHAEAKLKRARLLERLGRYSEAEAVLREALQIAVRERLWDAVWEANNELIFLVGERLGKQEEGLRYRETAMGLAGDDTRRRANVDAHVALVLHAQGDYAQAEALHRRALRGLEEVHGPESPSVATTYSNLAAVLAKQGRHEESEALTRRGLEIRERVFGQAHPTTISSRSNLALTLMLLGRLEEAESMMRAALDDSRRIYGDAHPDVAKAHNDLGLVLQQRDELTGAEEELRAALAIRTEVLGRRHRSTAESTANLADVLLRRGNAVEALALARDAHDVLAEALGPRHTHVAATRHTIGQAYAQTGAVVRAREELAAALAIWEEALGPEHPAVVRARADLAALDAPQADAEPAVSGSPSGRP